MNVRAEHLVIPVLLATCTAVACSAKSPPADAFVSVSATSTNGTCNFTSATGLFEIGSDITDGGGISNDPTRVSNGANEGGTVTLSCSVKDAGGGNFDIELSAELATSQQGAGGSMTIRGTVNSTGATQTIAGAFAAAGNSYSESDCSITYPANAPTPPVAPGRIWGEISCPNALLEGQTQGSSGNPISCDISALFIFENCGS